jgi:hypothetical protein
MRTKKPTSRAAGLHSDTNLMSAYQNLMSNDANSPSRVSRDAARKRALAILRSLTAPGMLRVWTLTNVVHGNHWVKNLLPVHLAEHVERPH